MYDVGWLDIVNIDVSFSKVLPQRLKAKTVVFKACDRGHEGTSYQSGEDAMARNGYTGSEFRG
jgi:hypothetical protein